MGGGGGDPEMLLARSLARCALQLNNTVCYLAYIRALAECVGPSRTRNGLEGPVLFSGRDDGNRGRAETRVGLAGKLWWLVVIVMEDIGELWNVEAIAACRSELHHQQRKIKANGATPTAFKLQKRASRFQKPQEKHHNQHRGSHKMKGFISPRRCLGRLANAGFFGFLFFLFLSLCTFALALACACHPPEKTEPHP